jgi:hypothetical protein
MHNSNLFLHREQKQLLLQYYKHKHNQHVSLQCQITDIPPYQNNYPSLLNTDYLVQTPTRRSLRN